MQKIHEKVSTLKVCPKIPFLIFFWNASYSTVRLGTSLQLICVAGSGYDVLKCVLTWQFTAYSVSCVLVHLVSVLSGHGGQLQFNVGSLCAVTFNFIYRAFTVSVDKFVGICNQVWWYVCVTCFTWESVGFYLTPCKQSLRKWVNVDIPLAREHSLTKMG